MVTGNHSYHFQTLQKTFKVHISTIFQHYCQYSVFVDAVINNFFSNYIHQERKKSGSVLQLGFVYIQDPPQNFREKIENKISYKTMEWTISVNLLNIVDSTKTTMKVCFRKSIFTLKMSCTCGLSLEALQYASN